MVLTILLHRTENTELTNNRNQRAAAYRRFTNGAFRAQQIGGLTKWEGQNVFPKINGNHVI